MKTTGEKIKSLRIALGLSQEQLSETIDVAHKSIYRYETGKSLPDTTTLVKLATYAYRCQCRRHWRGFWHVSD